MRRSDGAAFDVLPPTSMSANRTAANFEIDVMTIPPNL
jgi:hypothetical protein